MQKRELFQFVRDAPISLLSFRTHVFTEFMPFLYSSFRCSFVRLPQRCFCSDAWNSASCSFVGCCCWIQEARRMNDLCTSLVEQYLLRSSCNDDASKWFIIVNTCFAMYLYANLSGCFVCCVNLFEIVFPSSNGDVSGEWCVCNYRASGKMIIAIIECDWHAEHEIPYFSFRFHFPRVCLWSDVSWSKYQTNAIKINDEMKGRNVCSWISIFINLIG